MTNINKSELVNIIKECVNEGLHWTTQLTKKDLNKIVHINHIYGVTEDEESKVGKLDQKLVYSYIIRNMPWLLSYGYKSEVDGSWITPFEHFFKVDLGYTNWSRAFGEKVDGLLHYYLDWLHFPKEKLRGAAKYNRHWIKRFKWARNTFIQHPTFEHDLNKLKLFVQEFEKRSPINPKNKANYPLYVSLYQRSREHGGPEEGGWDYEHNSFIKSIKVNSYQEVRKAVAKLLKEMYDLVHENPYIILEKREGSETTTHRPHYS